jgi:hypothetical protein
MLSVAVSALFNETFLITLIPLLFITLWKRLYYEKFVNMGKPIIFAILGLAPYYLITKFYDSLIIDRTRIQMEAFSVAFERASHIDFWFGVWPSIASFLSDNFTWWYVFFGICGVLFISIKYKTLLARLTFGYLAALIIFCGIVSGKIAGHAYYHFPFLHIVVIMSAYFIFTIGTFIKQLINKPYIETIALILIIMTVPAIQESNARVFGTVFYGGDVVGDYIKQHTAPSERFFILGHSQTLSACTYAQRYCGEWNNESDMKYLEDKYEIQYIAVDAYRMSTIETNKAWNYIKDNYYIVWIGLLPNGNQVAISNIILKKGGKYNMSELQTKQPFLVKTYDGGVPYYAIENEN